MRSTRSGSFASTGSAASRSTRSPSTPTGHAKRQPDSRSRWWRRASLLADGAAAYNLDAAAIEAAAAAAGFTTEQTIRVDSEWRERMLEDGEWDANDQLLRLSRLRRREAELVERFGASAVHAYLAGRLWLVYHVIGKLAGMVYVWQRSA